ncbi:MAG: glycosyltransferase family 4 protein [Verrucomicrobiales bacterium]|nr:glycosyltransferase family 4 protein [Verrucomicrobiales bacterium]
MRVGLLHYSYAPVIGGVEFVMEQHATLFARRGFEVVVVCGEGDGGLRGAKGVRVVTLPELVAGRGGGREDLVGVLGGVLEGCDVVFVHNVLVMPFNMDVTAALWRLAKERSGVRWVNWIHDIAAVNPDYVLDLEGEMRALTQAAEGFEHVAISKLRQEQFCRLTGVLEGECPVVPNGVEYLRLMRLTERVKWLVEEFGVLYRDIVLINPTRVLRRKNIEMGVRVVAQLKALGAKVLYLVTGAPDPHNPASSEYGEELKRLILELGVEREVIFLSELFRVEDDDLISLYQVSDALFFPSRREGFGLPLLEAAMFRIPAFCVGREPMRSVLKHNVQLIDADADAEDVAVRVISVLGERQGFLARKEVMRKYSWDRLYDGLIGPMFLGQ